MKNEMTGQANRGFDSGFDGSDVFGQKAEGDSAPGCRPEFEYMEGGWGWVVVVASAYSFGILYGMVGNYALIFNKFEEVYNGTENHVFYAGSVKVCTRLGRDV